MATKLPSIDPTETIIRDQVNEIPDQWLSYISHFILGFNATTIDFKEPHIRPSIKQSYWLFIILYSVLIIWGVLTNVGMIVYIIRFRLYHDPTNCFLVNIAICNILKCAIVLPITLMVQLIENWIFGQFLCYFLPMLQDIPIHVTMLSFLLIAVDRYHLTQDPMKPRIPAVICALGTWFLAVCIVLPYPIYITYIDLGTYEKLHFEGVGICALNLVDDIQEYIRPLFVIMYIAPLASMAYFYTRTSRELEVQDRTLTVTMFENRPSRSRQASASSRSRADSHSTADSRSDFDNLTQRGSHCSRNNYRSSFEMYEGEFNVCKEIRTQKYLTMMVLSFAICLFPLMILRLARLAIIETYENSRHFDLIFLLIVWIAFIPTVTMPFFYLLWQMSRLTKERLCGYFRFSKRKLEQSTTDIVTTYTSVSSTTGGGIVLGVVTNNLIGVGIHRNNNSIQIRNSTHEAIIANGTVIEHQVTDNNDIDTECITTMNTKELNTTSISPTFITLPLTSDNNDAENLGDFDGNVNLSSNSHAPLQRQKYNRNRSRRSSKHNNQLLENGMPKEIFHS